MTDPQPVTDLSARAVSLAREIDRLPPGDYVIRLVKCEIRALPWQAEIMREQPVRVMELGKATTSLTAP
jgi:hypothetical protein